MSDELTNSHKAGRLLKLIGWLSMIAIVGISSSIIIPIAHSGEAIEDLGYILLGIVLAASMSVLCLITGNALKRDKKWAKVTGAVIASLILLSFPIGTLIGVFALFYLYMDWNESHSTT